MRIVFCLEPFEINTVDFVYKDEFKSAKEAGFQTDFIDFEVLVREGNAIRATRFIKPYETIEQAIYRGWMLKPKVYKKLYHSLLEKNIQLINSPTEYKNCHYFSENYKFIEDYTPQSVFFEINEKINFEQIFDKISVFGNKPIIIKDFVKSRKHEWFEACFIPNASDKDKVRKTIEKFIELQADDLNDGLVFREFVEFESLTNHSKSGMPLTKEFRLFFLHKKLIFSTEYWDEGNYNNSEIPNDFFEEIAQNIESNFFTMDIAKKENGDWLIVELGDGQVSGLPENANIQNFYQSIKNNL